MWLFAMFDLPVDTRENRRAYAQFRHTLVKTGFTMLQFSVYARHLPSEDAAAVYRRIVKEAIPGGGEVRIMAVTDHQFGRMEVYEGKERVKTEKPLDQMLLF